MHQEGQIVAHFQWFTVSFRVVGKKGTVFFLMIYEVMENVLMVKPFERKRENESPLGCNA
jgi:hypothetical protein